jgi:HPt (histidine-containing phosphotransfer) domain-containing protein
MSHEPALDPQAIAALKSVVPDDNGAFLRELIAIFLADTPPRIADLARSASEGDATEVLRAAHSIKGAAGNFGAHRLADLARMIESHAKHGELTLVCEKLPALRAAFAEVQGEMETYGS